MRDSALESNTSEISAVFLHIEKGALPFMLKAGGHSVQHTHSGEISP